jgi:hypothetical protein
MTERTKLLKIKTNEGWKKVAVFQTRTLAEKEGYAYMLLSSVSQFKIDLARTF